jgi:hypothetical protein
LKKRLQVKLRVKWSFSIFGVMLLITISHYLVPIQFYLSHEILERLYYLPIVVAAFFLWQGRRAFGGRVRGPLLPTFRFHDVA